MALDSPQMTPEHEDDDLADTQTTQAITGTEVAPAEPVTCPVCGLVNLAGATICSRCLTNWATTEITAQFDVKSAAVQAARTAGGTTANLKPTGIILEIGSVQLPITIDGVVIVGRNQRVSDGQPRSDVDLTPFGAAHKGVSRKHVKFTRDNLLIFVSDLGSTNGTLLNGQPIAPYARRTLRNGDELQLGQLKLKIILPESS